MFFYYQVVLTYWVYCNFDYCAGGRKSSSGIRCVSVTVKRLWKLFFTPNCDGSTPPQLYNYCMYSTYLRGTSCTEHSCASIFPTELGAQKPKGDRWTLRLSISYGQTIPDLWHPRHRTYTERGMQSPPRHRQAPFYWRPRRRRGRPGDKSCESMRGFSDTPNSGLQVLDLATNKGGYL